MGNNFNEWDNASKEWIEIIKINRYRSDVLMPETVKILGDIKGKDLLDIGCGEGGYSRLLAEKGAHVVGVDYSKELINEAQRHKSEYDIQYYVKDACHLEGIANDSFDFVVSAMCFMAIKNLQCALNEAYRVLKTGGILVLSILHPCYVREDYFNEGAYSEELSEHMEKPITFWHKTLSKTINCMLSAGFILELLSEPKLNGRNYPMFLVLKLVK